jgi:CDP-glycerol glycerophosphotransferase (TagB/SpsB family)
MTITPPHSDTPSRQSMKLDVESVLRRQSEHVAELQQDLLDRELQELSLRTHKRPLILFFGRSTFCDNTKYAYLDALKELQEFEVRWCAGNTALAQQLRAHGLPVLDLTGDARVVLRELLQCAVALFCENIQSAFAGNPAFAGALAGAQKIQLWHGISVKHLDLMLLPYVNMQDRVTRQSLRLASRPDYSLSTAAMFDVFWAQAHGARQVIRAGQPRNTVLLRQANALEMIGAEMPASLRAVLEDDERRAVLVMPTWKRKEELFTSSRDFHERMARWAIAENAVVVVKPHPFMRATPLPPNIADRVVFLDAGIDVYPWLSRFDALITDYSSVMFDFVLTGNPVFTYDTISQVAYGFEPDWSLVPDTSFRYVFDKHSLEAVLSENWRSHPNRESQGALCRELYATDPLRATETINRVIRACYEIAIDRQVEVIELDES